MTGICEHCGESLRGKRAHARYCDSSCRGDATRVRQELSGEREESAQKRSDGRRSANKNWQAVAEEAILDHFRNPEHESFHADDLWHVIPDEHRGVISLAVMALVNKKLIVGCGYRKSAIPSRKRSPSQEYRLTELGRDRLIEMGGAFTASEEGSAFASPVQGHASAAHLGESPARVRTGVPLQGGGRPAGAPVLNAGADPGEGSSEVRRQPAVEEPRPLFEEEKAKSLSAFTDAEAA